MPDHKKCVNKYNCIEKSQQRELLNQIIYWRRLSGEMSCKLNKEGTGPTGGWCLTSDNADWGPLGKSAVNHVVADSGIGQTLMKYISNEQKKPSLLDICAGVGQYGHWLKLNNASIDWTGFDGAENIESFTDGYVKWIDVTNPVFDTIENSADWVMSLECGEHIPPEYTDNFLDLLDRHNKNGIILSWAIPGQGGHSHINCLSNDEIKSKLFARKYFQDDWCLSFEKEAREHATYSWFRNTFMVFKRTPIA